MRPGKRHRRNTDHVEGPSIADFYKAMLGGQIPPIAVPTYQDYMEWKSTTERTP